MVPVMKRVVMLGSRQATPGHLSDVATPDQRLLAYSRWERANTPGSSKTSFNKQLSGKVVASKFETLSQNQIVELTV